MQRLHPHTLLAAAVLLAALQGQALRAQALGTAVLDTADHLSLGLARAQGARVSEVFAATPASDHYCNGAVPVFWKGRLYCMWQSSLRDEDSPDTRVVYSVSDDMGVSWSPPVQISPVLSAPGPGDVRYAPGGWLATGEGLVAYIGCWRGAEPSGTVARVLRSPGPPAGEQWGPVRDVLALDGSPVSGVLEQDPRRVALPSGGSRILGAGHFPPGVRVRPLYTDDPSGLGGWRAGDFQPGERGDQTRELEPSLYMRTAPGGAAEAVMVFRDQSSSYRKRYAVSGDFGQTWSAPLDSGIPDSRSKQCAGNLPGGEAYLVGNPTGRKDRTVLAVLVSGDGRVFTLGRLVEGAEDLPGQRYPGRAKTPGYSYPKAVVAQGWLFIAYSVGKERIHVAGIPVGQLVP